jgi:peroxin-5
VGLLPVMTWDTTDDEVAAVDWETAFLAQEASTQSQSPLLSTQQLHDDAMQESYIRPASPLQTDTVARDALARTAALLLTTVQSQPQSDKFANSTFLDLMRKLRDGEVAVEGDKVVEQIGAHNMGKGKGRAMDSGHDEAWAHDFLASGGPTREEEGRTGAGMGAMGMGMGMQGLSTRDLMNGAGIGRISTARDHIREMARPEGSGHLWEEEDRVREGRESRARERKVQFQGDGGGMTEDAMEVEEDDFLPERSREQQRMDTSVPLASSYWEEDFDAASITGGHGVARPRTAIQMQMSAQEKEWETLQADWDNFEATATGISQVQDPTSSSAQASASATSSAYLNATSSINAVPMSIGGYDFAMSNPYVLTQYSPPTRTHALHASPRSTYDTILEQEAAVQRNPRDPQKWLALGIKQQENEREEMAIKALQRALELDPGMGEAYLALAVSFTNENERARSYDSVDRWIDSLAVSRYTREIADYRDLFGPLPMSDGLKAKGDYLTNLLIVLAQSRAAKDLGDVDADVQIGLGVLFNTSEEYDKAGDCFESALSVRPDVSVVPIPLRT